MRSATSDKRWEPTRLEKLTECSVYMTPEGPRIWCEADLAGPCQGCPEANRG